jgi:hypothetical protein
MTQETDYDQFLDRMEKLQERGWLDHSDQIAVMQVRAIMKVAEHLDDIRISLDQIQEEMVKKE